MYINVIHELVCRPCAIGITMGKKERKRASLPDGSRADKVQAFGIEGRGFEPSHHWLTSPLHSFLFGRGPPPEK